MWRTNSSSFSFEGDTREREDEDVYNVIGSCGSSRHYKEIRVCVSESYDKT